MSYCAGQLISERFRAGIIALAGRPNVGKSTLLNCLLGQKISITSRKANTTRHRILGVLSELEHQFVFIDLPGLNPGSKRPLERSIYKSAVSSISGTDLILFLIESSGWQADDMMVWQKIKQANTPAVIVITKIDRIKNKNFLLPMMHQVFTLTGLDELVPVSATKSENTELLKSVIYRYLPKSPPLFSSDFVTDRDDKFFASELVREQLFRYYGDELPYASAVQIEKYDETKELLHVEALIWVESKSQKGIIIGKGGKKIKKIGVNVRTALESKLNQKVYLQLWVKVRSEWTDDLRLAALLEYSEWT